MRTGPLGGAPIAITAERRATEQAALVRALGGVPLVCPTVRVVWDDDPAAFRRWMEAVGAGPDDVVFMTGMGAERLLAAAAAEGRAGTIVGALRRSRVVIRGSKARPVLRRYGIDDMVEPQPPTTGGVVRYLGETVAGHRLVVQLAEPEPAPIVDLLRARGARVTAVCPYRYPADGCVGRADELLDAILDGRLAAVTFTSAASVEGLVTAATVRGAWEEVRDALGGLVVAAVGPVTAAALRRHGLPVHVEPEEPRLGPMMRALAAALDARRASRPGERR